MTSGVTASRSAAVNSIEVKNAGTVKLQNIKTVEHANGNLVAVSRSGEVVVADEVGRERERYKLPYGATVSVHDGDQVEGGQVVANYGKALALETDDGGIVPALAEFAAESPMRRRFEERGALSSYAAPIPLWIILDELDRI